MKIIRYTIAALPAALLKSVKRVSTVMTVILALGALGASAATNHVWQDSPTPTPPYSSWDTAAHLIQDAVDAASPGDTVLVTNGVYATGGAVIDGQHTRIAVTSPLNVVSVNGPDVTIIEGYQVPVTLNGEGAIRCVYLTGGATLSGFTLTRGATMQAGNGGGVWCETGDALVTNCMLLGNAAYNYGGGAYRGTVKACTLSGNAASRGGGAYAADLIDCDIVDNWAGSFAGGAHGGSLTRCLIDGNEAEYGGGIVSTVASDCMISGNSARFGGGSYWSTLDRCILQNNSARDYGGGTQYGLLRQCSLLNNSASSFGGGAYNATLRGCTIAGNQAYVGAGAMASELYNCTVVGNRADSAGGGVSVSDIFNSILYFNRAPSWSNYTPSCNLEYSCASPLPETGAGNIGDDPLLASLSHLSQGSPCIGAGSAEFADGADIDGEAWRMPPSMGCDEYQTGSIDGLLDVSINASYTESIPGYRIEFTGLVEGRTSGSVWDFGDGTVISNQPIATHAWAAEGDYPVVLRVFNERFPAGISATQMIHVVDAVYYVRADGMHPEVPYDSWATAAANIQDAVDAATVAGALVLVDDGVYATGGRAVTGLMTNRLTVDKPLTVRSVNGPEYTIIQGAMSSGSLFDAGAVRCVYLDDEASLSGFTLTNGTTLGGSGMLISEVSGAGVYCESTNSQLSNCVLAQNSAYYDGGGAYGGTLTDCMLVRNRAYHFGGGSFEGILNNCVLVTNFSNRGGGAYNSVMTGCLITGNRSPRGGGAYSGVLNNCTIAGNSLFVPSLGEGGGTHSSILENCILYYNHGDEGANYVLGDGEINYSCTYPMPTNGIGNITNTPRFVDTNYWADLRIRADSPCIDAGSNDFAIWYTDLDGNPRIVNGIVDMGAYEFVPPTPAERVEQLIARVTASNLQQKQPLLAALKAALASIRRGNCHSAIGQLHALQNKAGAQVADSVFAAELMMTADEIIKALECNDSGLPYSAAELRVLRRK